MSIGVGAALARGRARQTGREGIFALELADDEALDPARHRQKAVYGTGIHDPGPDTSELPPVGAARRISGRQAFRTLPRSRGWPASLAEDRSRPPDIS